MLKAFTTSGRLNYQNIPIICDKSDSGSVVSPIAESMRMEIGKISLNLTSQEVVLLCQCQCQESFLFQVATTMEQ